MPIAPLRLIRAALRPTLAVLLLALAVQVPAAGAGSPARGKTTVVARAGLAKPVPRAAIPSCRAARTARTARARLRARRACARRWSCRSVRVRGGRRALCTPRARKSARRKSPAPPRAAAPAATSSTTPTPAAARVHWNGDFSTGSWSQWDSADDDCRSQDHAVLAAPALSGDAKASRHTVTADSTLGQSGTRCLVYNDPKSDPTEAKSHAYAGAESWYEDSIYFPADFAPAPRTDWNWVWQLHNWPDSEGPVNLVAGVITDSSDGGPSGGERLSLRVIGGGSPAHPIDGYGTGDYDDNPDVREQWLRGPDIRRGQWHRLVVRVKWSRHADGRVDYWLDGQLVGSHDGPNLFYHASGDGHDNPDHAGQAYYSVGYYRSRDSLPPATVYHAGTRVYGP